LTEDLAEHNTLDEKNGNIRYYGFDRVGQSKLKHANVKYRDTVTKEHSFRVIPKLAR
jgi:hypothetical protein